jgi:NTE family protein
MRTLAAALALLLAAACASNPTPVNPPLTQPASLANGYRWATTTIPKRDSRTLVILTFSGGGTRAAGLSYGVLRELQATPMRGAKNLLGAVDVISSVSGGSFASMEYGMRGDAMLNDFETKMLRNPIQKKLFAAAFLNPRNLLKLLFNPNFHRIDVAVQVYEKEMFGEKTFTDLAQLQRENDRPLIIANSTELEIGSRFEWTQDQFDAICSDLSRIPVARAVAASSNFPILLPPMVLRKYDAATCTYKTPSWLSTARDNDAYLNPSRPRYATEIEGYLNPARTWLHLLDGGIADNIGLRGPLQAMMSTDTYVQPQGTLTGFTLLPLLNHAPGSRAIDRVLVVVVNAGTGGPVSIDKTPRVPPLPTIIGGISTTPMDNYSFDSLQLLVSTFTAMRDSGIRFYPVIVSFPLIRDATLRADVNQIGTSFDALSEPQLNALKRAADVLIHQDPCFQQFVRDANGTPTAADAPLCGTAPPTP